jgi:formylglycine-generating enzyme required for sulfatase activity
VDAANACRFANVFDQSARRSVRDTRVPHGCSDGFADAAPVGSFQPNAFGLHDMIGNAWQWTADCWAPDYRNASGSSAARNAPNCTVRTLRGGSFMSEPANARVTSRMQSDADDRDITFGFRVARDPD